MKIVVLEGSPNKHGSSIICWQMNLSAARRRPAHTVQVIDAAHSDIHPCTGCIHCGYEAPVSRRDDVEKFRREILEADMMVFVTPLYYYGMSAQLKTLIDRFCAFNGSIQSKTHEIRHARAAWNSDGWTFEALEAHYQTLVRYLNLRDMGAVWGKGCGSPSMTKRSRCLKLAYELGRGLK